jgi:hypothetical protein
MMNMVIVVQVATAVLVNMVISVMATITQIVDAHHWCVIMLVIMGVIAAACGKEDGSEHACNWKSHGVSGSDGSCRRQETVVRSRLVSVRGGAWRRSALNMPHAPARYHIHGH